MGIGLGKHDAQIIVWDNVLGDYKWGPYYGATAPGQFLTWTGTTIDWVAPGPSDIRLKENIVTLTDGLLFINSLNPVQFTWKKDANKIPAFGLIAQEVGAVFKGELHSIYREDPNMWTLDYNQFIAPLIKAVQELSAKVVKLENEIIELKK
jgi:hypothetical protein